MRGDREGAPTRLRDGLGDDVHRDLCTASGDRDLTHGDGLVEAPQLGETPAQERAGKLGGRTGLAEPLGRPRTRQRGYDLLEELNPPSPCKARAPFGRARSLRPDPLLP